ncbi:aminoacyl-tRNA hydrolase [Methylocystis parvus]|uniref:aminoacyl-tRNA hydrolase n=1 Tax=Methylocystis parvus TaxID=134 RepID=UPI003C711968
MLLFVGLGNPGRQYARNRHNIGFMAIEAIARRHGFATARSRYQGLVSEGNIGGEKVLLLEPQTYMNESGRSVGEAARFHKIAVGDIVVFHDELDLAPAKCRVKVGGGVAGHNGLRSITAHVGNDYKRVRMGIGHPGDKSLVHGYVLNDFAKAEEPWVETMCDALADNAALLVKGDDAGLQNKLHLAMEAKGFGAVKRVGEKD